MGKAVDPITHFKNYVKGYTDQQVTLMNAVLNYTRQFPHAVPRLIVALLQESEKHENNPSVPDQGDDRGQSA